MQERESTWKAADSASLYTRTWLPDSTTRPVASIVLVHGLGEHSGRYRHVAGFLTGHGYAVHTFDLRGHGQTPGPRGHVPSYNLLMTDIQDQLDQAAAAHPGLPQFLYGHSLGGSLVLNFGLRCQPKLAGVIATSPGLRTTTPVKPSTERIGRALASILPSVPLSSGLEQAAISQDPAVVRAYQTDPLVHPKISTRFGVDVIDSGEWALAHAGQWTLPLLLLHGAADRITSRAASRQFAQTARGDVTFQEFPGGYHELHNEPFKEQVFALMLAWLEAHRQPAA